MRAIFLNRYFHPDHSATSQMVSDLAFGLAKTGMRVTVITSRMRYDAPEQRLPRRERIAGVEIIRVATTRFGRARLALRALDYLTFYLAATQALLMHVRKGDAIVAMTDPPMLSVAVLPIARLRGARVVNWLQDVFPEVAMKLGVAKATGGLLLRLLLGLRNGSLRCSDLNVAIGRRMAEHLQSLGIERRRLCTIANWADCQTLMPVAPNRNDLRRDWGLSEDFVVGYSGNLGRAHEVGTLIGAIEGCRELKNLRWLFIGGGAGLDDLRRQVAERRLASVVFQPYQPRQRLSDSLSAADVHLVSLRPELEGLIVPSKFYGVAAAGRPTIFIGSRNGEIARVISQAGCGLTVATGDAPALIAAVQALASDPGRAQEMGARARRLCETRFDMQTGIAAWRDQLTALSKH